MTLDREDGEPGAALKSVKEALRAVPGRGLGYGLLRYLGEPDVASRLAALPQSQILFNYLGQFDQVLPAGSLFGFAAEGPGPGRSPRGERSHEIEINGLIADGRLRLDWSFSGRRFRRETVADLADGCLAELRRLIGHCLSPEAGGYTPSDFPLSRLDAASLDRIFAGERGIEDLYPLAPLQEGLLFHTLSSPGSGVYVLQLNCTVHGELDTAAFRRAWEAVVERHPVLRTSFRWRGLDAPLQAVHGRVETGELPVVEADPVQMAQLLQNLISNALKFHRKDAAPVVRMSSRRVSPQEVEIQVEDNGIGFDMQYLDRIFQPFQRLHGRSEYEGSGVGLPICRRIAERHGGSITARSSPGEGAVFVVTLPVRHG